MSSVVATKKFAKIVDEYMREKMYEWALESVPKIIRHHDWMCGKVQVEDRYANLNRYLEDYDELFDKFGQIVFHTDEIVDANLDFDLDDLDLDLDDLDLALENHLSKIGGKYDFYGATKDKLDCLTHEEIGFLYKKCEKFFERNQYPFRLNPATPNRMFQFIAYWVWIDYIASTPTKEAFIYEFNAAKNVVLVA